MKRAQHGSTVSIQYIGTLDDGSVFDRRTEEEHLDFTIGANEVFPALEQAVVGMAVGEAKNIVIPAGKAFGPRLAENIITVARTEFPSGREIRVGQRLRIGFAAGVERILLVTAVGASRVTLDGNHPLAGLDLTFALQLTGID